MEVGAIDDEDGSGVTIRRGGKDKLADILFWDVLQQVRTGKYSPDEKLPSENEFCRRFKVSRPVVREALQKLRSRGVIYSRQGAGSFVKGLADRSVSSTAREESPRLVKCIADVRNIYDFRIVFEGEMARLAATMADDFAIEEMRLALEEMGRALARQEPALEEDIAFHSAIARATRNQFYVEVLNLLQPNMRFVMELVMKLSSTDPEEHNTAVLMQHAALFERIRDRDSEASCIAMRTLLTNSRNRVFNGITTAEGADSS
jgi:GntR family transcriptional repressor for pyruvate dehydrogenase complex